MPTQISSGDIELRCWWYFQLSKDGAGDQAGDGGSVLPDNAFVATI
jgi:hypothetical protein